MDRLVELIEDESKWPAVSMGIALLAVIVLLVRHRRSATSRRRVTLAAMSLFFGIMIGTMAFGHSLAVTTKLISGTLEGSVPVFYAIGIALAAPSWWLAVHTRRVLDPNVDHGRRTLALHIWLTLTLVAMGIHNLPIAALGLLNIGYHLHSRRVVGRVIVAIAVIVMVAMFVGSVIFLASGQSFEEFGAGGSE